MKIKNAKLWFSDNFTNWILPEEPKKIPIFRVYQKNILPKPMNDEEILKEWNIEPYSISEFFGLIYFLLKKQPKGERGDLLTNGYANIFYVKLNDERVVAVHVLWLADRREWGCRTCGLGGSSWDVGNCERCQDILFGHKNGYVEALDNALEALPKWEKSEDADYWLGRNSALKESREAIEKLKKI